MSTIDQPPGPIVFFGSGETSASGRKIWEVVFQRLPASPSVALVETPAGFEPNSSRVIGRVGEFIEQRLQNYRPRVRIIPARKRGTPYSPDDPELVAPLLEADLIFMGPGSPSYAVRQLQGSLAWQYMLARQRLGAALIFASAAVVAASRYALPVYEIYKAGEELHWKDGLDIFGWYGLPLVFIPHWNNNDGGEELDTSRCFMGRERFASLAALLPPDMTMLGIDEKTALLVDIQAGTGQVFGLGGVTLVHTGPTRQSAPPDLPGSGLAELAQQRDAHVHIYRSGECFPLEDCLPLEPPSLGQGLPGTVWRKALQAARRQEADQPPQPPPEALRLLAARQAARQERDWASADRLRAEIAALGWQVLDTPEGPRLERMAVSLPSQDTL
jgi:cyanophycinase-like exopeptidase